MNKKALTKISFFTLAMLITGAIDSVRNLPASALFGATLIFFFLFSALIFLVPVALVSAELAAAMPEEGGIYRWSRAAFGENLAFLAIWLQWISNVFWLPTIFSFVAGTAGFLIFPELTENKYYLLLAILAILWFLTWINLKGLDVAAKFTAVCTVVGLIIPMALIIVLGLFWLFLGRPLAIELTPSSLLPQLWEPSNWIAITAIMTAYCGMELATVHSREVEQPQKNFPKALLLSVAIILFTMIFGSLSIAFVIPKNEINLVNGVMQIFSTFLNSYHLGFLLPLLTVMLIIGSMGGIISWLISPLKGLLHAAQQGFMPPLLKKVNAKGVPQNLLIVQGILVSLVATAFLMMPSINGSYWLLTALSTELYMLMYIMMFFAALRLRKRSYQALKATQGFKIPGGKLGISLICTSGLMGSLLTLCIGFIPPSSLNIGSPLRYELMFIGGLILMIVPCSLAYLYKSLHKI